MTALAITPDGTAGGALRADVVGKDSGGSQRRGPGAWTSAPSSKRKPDTGLEVMRQVRETFSSGIRPPTVVPNWIAGETPGPSFSMGSTRGTSSQFELPTTVGSRSRDVTTSGSTCDPPSRRGPSWPHTSSKSRRRARGRPGAPQIEIRTSQVTLDLHVTPKRTTGATLWAVLAREVAATVPAGRKAH